MVNNKISIDRFFEIGGVCQLILETLDGIEVVYPPNRDYYLNELLACGPRQSLKNQQFWWDGWYYEPKGLCNIPLHCLECAGNFYLFKTKKRG